MSRTIQSAPIGSAAYERAPLRRLLRVFGSARDLEAEFQPHILAIQETSPSPFTRSVLWSLTILLGALFAWSWFSTIPINTSAPAKFETAAHTKVLQTLNAGTVERILVRSGQSVHKGQALFELDPRSDRAALESETQQQTLTDLQLQRAHAELTGHAVLLSAPASASHAMIALETDTMRADLEHLRSQIESDRHQIGEAQANLAAGKQTFMEYTQQLALDRKQVAEAAPLVPLGAMAGSDLDKLKAQAIQDAGKLAAQTKQLSQLQQAVQTAQAKLEVDKTEFRTTRYQDMQKAQAHAYDIEDKLVSAQRHYALDWLRAPVDGTIQDLKVDSLGTVVEQGQTLATIVPSRAALVVDADLPAQRAGFIKVGQSVQIKVTAFPFEQYGSIPGRVIWISPTASTQSSIAQPPSGENHGTVAPASLQHPSQTSGLTPPMLYYAVHVLPQRDWLTVNGRRAMVSPGMTANIDVKIGRRRALEFFTDPIVKYMNKGIETR